MNKAIKFLPIIAGGLLGLAFIAFSLMFLLGMVPEQQPPPEGSPVALFMGALVPTGYLTFVKVFELIGGLLVAIPKTRNLGLLLLVPIIVNIIAFHALIAKAGLADPVILLILALTAYLLIHERGAFTALINKPWHNKPTPMDGE